MTSTEALRLANTAHRLDNMAALLCGLGQPEAAQRVLAHADDLMDRALGNRSEP